MWRAVGLLLLAACAGGDDDGGARDAGGGRDSGARDGGARDAGGSDAGSPGVDSGGGGEDAALPDAPPGTDAGTDAGAAPDAGTDAGPDAGPILLDGGCVPGTSRDCTILCEGGSTAMGREICFGGSTYGPCEMPSERCGDGTDDDGDGTIDEGCTVEGGCIWIRSQCQGRRTLNEVCESAGGRHLTAGRRCAVAGGAVVPLDVAYGTFGLCCCDVASSCVPRCDEPMCPSCVVWEEIQCCL